MSPWEPQHDTWKMQGIPDPTHASRYAVSTPQITGLAFDAQTRTLFVLSM